MNLSVWCQVFMEAVLAVVVFGIKIGFNDKGTHPQDKHSCSWRSRGFREPPHSVQGGAWSTDTWVWEEFSCLVTHCFFSVFFFFTTTLWFRVRVQVWFECRSNIVPFGSSNIEFKNSIKDRVSRTVQCL